MHTITALERDRETTFSHGWALSTVGLGALRSQFWLREGGNDVWCTEPCGCRGRGVARLRVARTNFCWGLFQGTIPPVHCAPGALGPWDTMPRPVPERGGVGGGGLGYKSLCT